MKRALKFALTLGITALCIFWTFRNVHWDHFWASLRSANYFWLLPYFAVLMAVHVCRTLRWGHLLSPLGKVPGWRGLNEASAIGFMMLIILPFRLGEFARPFLIAQRSNIRRSAAMTTVVLERIVDGISVAALLLALIAFLPPETENIDSLRAAGLIMFSVFFGGLMFLLFALWQRPRAVRFVRWVAGAISPRMADKAADIVDTFVGALKQLPSAGHAFAFIGYTIAYWLLNGWGMTLLSRAFDCSLKGSDVCDPLSMSLFQGFVVLGVLVVGLMIPAGPASAGTFQAAILIGLSIFFPESVVNASGIAYAYVLWVLQFGQQVLLGLVLLLISKQSFNDIAGKLDEGEAGATAKGSASVP